MELGLQLEIVETGDTFIENARLKARACFAASGVPTIAEDSGLEVDALGGQPGVLSARYLGLPDGPVKNQRLIELMADVPARRRRCRYVCAIVLVESPETERVFEGACSGRIAETPAGRGGFGFDPIVLIPSLGRTMAQLTEAEKNRMSHRGRAARKLARYLASRAG